MPHGSIVLVPIQPIQHSDIDMNQKASIGSLDRSSMTFVPVALVASAVLALSGCGGGSDADPAPAPPAPTLAQQTLAATTTANNPANACGSIQPFYWEIGDRNSVQASGSTDAASGTPTYNAKTPMSIASASKWLYGAYVAEKRGGVLNAIDIQYLHFQSGYVSFGAFGTCGFSDTVDSCLSNGSNGAFTASSEGKFNYDGGHMQKHASLDGLGDLNAIGMANEMRRVLGADISLSFSQPQLAGGVITSASDYGQFLRKTLSGSLKMGGLLGANAVCTNPSTCSAGVATPTPRGEDWSYSIGHWVDTDRVVGDGAFSSTGAFGFHPWIDAKKTSYGVIARRTSVPGTGFESAVCGRLMRKAWATGTSQ